MDRDGATAETCVVVGDLRLVLHVGDAAIVPDNLQAVACAVGATCAAVIMAREVEITSEGPLPAPTRLWPFRELAIEFGSFSLVEAPAPLDDDQPGEAGPGSVDGRVARACHAPSQSRPAARTCTAAIV